MSLRFSDAARQALATMPPLVAHCLHMAVQEPALNSQLPWPKGTHVIDVVFLLRGDLTVDSDGQVHGELDLQPVPQVALASMR